MKVSRRLSLLFLTMLAIALTSCGKVTEPKPGTYRMVIATAGGDLPLLLSLNPQPLQMALIHGDHSLPLENTRLTDGVLRAHLPDNGGTLNVTLSRKGFEGTLQLGDTAKPAIPVTAKWNVTHRFVARPATDNADISGTWLLDSATFKDGASLQLQQTHSSVDGRLKLDEEHTLIVSGQVDGDAVYLGSVGWGHALLFKGKVDERGELRGELWDGQGAKQSWLAHALTDPPAEQDNEPDPTRTTLLPWGLPGRQR